MAIMSGDQNMIEHAVRNQLDEDDPNYYDIHSNVAVLAFQLNVTPTKSALKEAKLEHLRVVAKTVIFGIAYGRGAKAIALEAKMEGIEISEAEAQRVIDTVFEMYPKLRPFFEQCKERATDPRWLCSCFGRFRRFPLTKDEKIQSEFERQAMNYPIQSMIASVVDRAAAYMQDYRDNVDGRSDLFRMLLQIHDALIIEVPYDYVEEVLDEVLPLCMVNTLPIYPTFLDGLPREGDGPYYLGLDKEIHKHWGEDLKGWQVDKLGLPHKTAGGVKIAA
jgi:DNA polymerase I-like protein with 3'-5' exonuclease and polymerase domains